MTNAEATMTDTERADLLEALATVRHFLRHTVQGLTDEQAARRPTVSELCLGGLIKHVTHAEAGWTGFVERGTVAMKAAEDSWTAHTDGFLMRPDDTLESILAGYAEVARRTDELVTSLPDLNVSHPLPEAPWFEPGARWSARRVFLHIVVETAQHAGHADILRETLDGQKSMG